MLRTIFRKSLTLRYQNKIFFNFSNMDKAQGDLPDISKMRVEYKPGGYLDEEQMEKNPINEFKKWFKDCVDSKKIMEPNAMVVCTATKDGIPNARPVLLKV
jgi:pyridoxine/pyridoxamine 5'-phosphate oxidase